MVIHPRLISVKIQFLSHGIRSKLIDSRAPGHIRGRPALIEDIFQGLILLHNQRQILTVMNFTLAEDKEKNTKS